MGSAQCDAFLQNLAASQLNGLVRSREAGKLKAYVVGLNLNLIGAPVDLPTLLVVPATRYIPVAAWVYDPTANLSTATLGLYTAAAGGGVEIIAPTALTNLTAATKIVPLTISALTDYVVVTSLIPRLTVDAGVAGTASLVMEFVDLSLI